MWDELLKSDRDEYRRMILAFAGLTEMFAQKSDTETNDEILAPIINSKYQESVFQRVFSAVAEDIGNTSYDASLSVKQDDGTLKKFLVGIKTFGINAGAQKIAQFKGKHNEWSDLINQMRNNAQGLTTKEEINKVNQVLYLDLATKVAKLRNDRILSSEAKLKGFKLNRDEDCVESVYHVLMPSKKGDPAAVHVGETSYNLIDESNISVIGCTGVRTPTNFDFSDGVHTYRYTSADSQLLMNFQNKDIVLEKWDVVYADDAYALFSKIADEIGSISEKNIYTSHDIVIKESYSWMIAHNDKVEKFSAYNNFYGVSSKIAIKDREPRIVRLIQKYSGTIDVNAMMTLSDHLREFLLIKANTNAEREEKALYREQIMEYVKSLGNNELIEDVRKLLYRTMNELYIPIPNARKFHDNNPNFFGPNIGTFVEGTKKLALPKEQCKFDLVFEPSGNKIKAFITQDDGKGIESLDKQSLLGEWILKEVFRLGDYEPLTMKRLDEIGINAIRLYKTVDNDDIHLQFIWIDKDNPPKDFLG